MGTPAVAPMSVKELDLRPIAGKQYFNSTREWREELIYFVMVDRFHDSVARMPVLKADRSAGFAAGGGFYGGTIRGVREHLDYIAGLGCTAVWMSPVFETNAYHGYDITDYLQIDPHFGTKQDLIDLVNAAHNFQRNGEPWPIRVILDVVINHAGNVWQYPGGNPYYYYQGWQFPLEKWSKPDRPVPLELRDEKFYHRRGQIRDFDHSPENQLGDISVLKDFANDDDATGSELIDTLARAHCYWIREADVDGFRVDAVKHMGAEACARFCSDVREYAYSLGKRGFFLFGEVATPDDDVYNSYIGPNTRRSEDGKTVFFGLNSVLDFRLAEGVWGDDNNAPLREVLLGNKPPQTLFNRLEAQRYRALNRGEMGRYLVTFVDNHDSFWQPGGRIGALANDDQMIGIAGFLICALGTPCLYYGTEQGFSGKGDDTRMREAMFDNRPGGQSVLNPNCWIYQEITAIADVMRHNDPLRFGRMYYRQISGNGVDFGFPYGSTYTLAFSRLLYGEEVLVAYNVSGSNRYDRVLVDKDMHDSSNASMKFLYGGAGSVPVQKAGAIRFVELDLKPHQFVILQ